MKSHQARCAVCNKEGRTGFGFEELMTPGFKLSETMTCIAGFKSRDGIYHYGRTMKYVHHGACYNTFKKYESKYRTSSQLASRGI